jgi:hypothetical protein
MFAPAYVGGKRRAQPFERFGFTHNGCCCKKDLERLE